MLAMQFGQLELFKACSALLHAQLCWRRDLHCKGLSEGGREGNSTMLTIWKLDGLQSHCLGKCSQMVKAAEKSSPGRSHQWLCVPTSFTNRDRQQGLIWCAGTRCYLKKQLRAVGWDNSGEHFLLIALGSGEALIVFRGLHCISMSQVAPWGLRTQLQMELPCVHTCV